MISARRSLFLYPTSIPLVFAPSHFTCYHFLCSVTFFLMHDFDLFYTRPSMPRLKVLDATFPETTLAFPDFDKRPLQHLERKVQTSAKTIGHTLPSATAFRKFIEIRNKRLSGPMRDAVSRSLSHSLGTAEQYYQAPSLNDVYSTSFYSHLQMKRGEPPSLPHTLPQGAHTIHSYTTYTILQIMYIHDGVLVINSLSLKDHQNDPEKLMGLHYSLAKRYSCTQADMA